jgi:hypothetical protein
MVSFKLRSLYARGKSPATLSTGGWVNPRARLDEIEK